MRLRIFGNILNKAKLTGTKPILTLKNAVIHTLYVWVDDKDAEIVVDVDGQRISFTADKLYKMSIRAYDSGMIVRGIPQLLVYDDTNDIYLMSFALNERVHLFSLMIVAPSGRTIEYAYQVMAEVSE